VLNKAVFSWLSKATKTLPKDKESLLFSRGPYPTADSNDGADSLDSSNGNIGTASIKAVSAKANDSLKGSLPRYSDNGKN
jgi:hypothetical protein